MNCRQVEINGRDFMLYETVNEGPILDEYSAGLSRDYVLAGIGNITNSEIHATATVGYAKEELVSGLPNYPIYINIANRSSKEVEEADLFMVAPTIEDGACLSNYVISGLKEVLKFNTTKQDETE